MKCLLIEAPQKAVVRELPEPKVKNGNDVLVKIHASSICNQHEWKVFNDKYVGEFNKQKYPLPFGAPGHEAAGEVIEIGSEVRTVKPGDKVVMCGWSGDLHKEFVLTTEEWLGVTSSNLSYSDIAPTELFACMVGLLNKSVFIKDSRAVVIGMGPAGLTAIDVLRSKGAKEIICLDIAEKKLERALELGADKVINVKDEDEINVLIKSLPEIAIDCSGSHKGFEAAFKIANRESLLFGYNDSPFMVNQSEWFAKSLSIHTQFAFDLKVWKETVEMLDRDQIHPDKVISHKLPFSAENYTKALNMLSSENVYKIILEY